MIRPRSQSIDDTHERLFALMRLVTIPEVIMVETSTGRRAPSVRHRARVDRTPSRAHSSREALHGHIVDDASTCGYLNQYGLLLG